MTAHGILVFLLVAALASANDNPDSEYCHVLERDVRNVLDQLFRRLPPERSEDSAGPFDFAPEVTLGNITTTGLDTLKLDPPYQALCRGDDRVVRFTLTSKQEIALIVPWWYCEENEGSFTVTAGLSRFEGEVVVTRTPEGLPVLRLQSLLPIFAEEIKLHLRGLGDTVYSVFRILGYLFTGGLRAYWVDGLKMRLDEALVEELAKLQSVV